MTEQGVEYVFPSTNHYAFRVRFYPLPSPMPDELGERRDHHCYLIITNISKKANIKALIAAAAAHRFTPVLVGEPNITELDCCIIKPANRSVNALRSKTTAVPMPDVSLETKIALGETDPSCSDNSTHNSTAGLATLTVQPACEYIPVLRCDTMDVLVQYLAAVAVPLVGIEIMDSARSILADDAFPTTSTTTLPTTNASTSGSRYDSVLGSQSSPQSDSSARSDSQSNAQSNHRIAFIPGNEGTGLSAAHKVMCNGQFVYIPHYGAGDSPCPGNLYLPSPLIFPLGLNDWYLYITLDDTMKAE